MWPGLQQVVFAWNNGELPFAAARQRPSEGKSRPSLAAKGDDRDNSTAVAPVWTSTNNKPPPVIRMRAPGQAEPTLKEAIFGTYTRDLERLAHWQKEHKVRHVAMESSRIPVDVG
jgi:hypothetical protein